MFETIYTCQRTIVAHRSAPLLEERCRYLTHRARSGAKRRTVRKIAANQLSLIKYLDLDVPRKFNFCQIEAAAQSWSHMGQHWYGRGASANALAVFIGQAVGWLEFIGWYEKPPEFRHRHKAEVAAYTDWMNNERGLSEQTIINCRTTIDGFLTGLDERKLCLADLTIEDVDRVMIGCQISGSYRRGTVRAYVSRVRGFLRYCARRGWCNPQLAAGIAPVQKFPDQPLSRGFGQQEALKLLSTTQGKCDADQRDRAILMLLVIYGLRSVEVRGMQLEDLNWEQGTFRVHSSKSGRSGVYPLSDSTGDAIISYLSEVRPTGFGRTLFLTLRAPYRPLGDRAIYGILDRRKAQAGISGSGKGPHSLRHAVAQNLLDQGLSMKAVGDYLGHRSVCATSVYAKVNLNTLREVAELELEVPA